MASATVKSTFSLDLETAQRLERLARAWGVSKSEVLRQAIRDAPATPPGAPHPALARLKQLHADGGRQAGAVKRWAEDARAERAASSAQRETKGRRRGKA
jgi:predicted transcriptional regulator